MKKFLIVPFLFLLTMQFAYASYDVQFNKRGWDKYSEMVVRIAEQTPDVEPLEMTVLLSMESNFGKYTVNKRNRSVGGIFQFTDGTWREMIKESGKKHGIKRGTPKSNDVANIKMTAELIRKNKRILRKYLNREDISLEEVYMAHLLGVYGAAKILSANDNTLAARLVRPGGNKSYFYRKGKARTVKQFKENLRRKVHQHASVYRDDVYALMTSDSPYEVAMR